jgi:hypothetical protein
LPIGEYDKHAIGYKDYEDLADEVMRSGPAHRDHAFNTLKAAQDFLKEREELTGVEEPSPAVQWPTPV